MEDGGLCPGPPAPKPPGPPGPPGAEAPSAHRGLRIGPPFLKWFRSKFYDLFPLMNVSAHRVCA